MTACARDACEQPGIFPAPKSRKAVLNRPETYWWFCLEHVKDYNLKWNYYAGMTAAQIDADRYTDRFTRVTQDRLGCENNKHSLVPPPRTAISSALRLFNLNLDYTHKTLRQRFCQLVKALHPDANGNGDAARLHAVCEAYQLLKDHLGSKSRQSSA